MTNLTQLWLEKNSISDISPLANLTNLTQLLLGGNSVSDISPLSNLTNLTQLWLEKNIISDISPIANLTNLTQLLLDNNSISDISPLANLTNLTQLFLNNNSISDISVLSHLASLAKLSLNVNRISDISPLTLNAGLGVGDFVDVSENPLISVSINTHIPFLRSRGVEVRADNLKPPPLEYTLSIPAGAHIIHIPLAVNQINGEDRTIDTVGDLYNALGDAVKFIITIDKDGNWITYHGNESTGSMADAPIGGDTGLIAVMNSAATLELVGGTLGTAGTAQITLLSGNNLVGVPLNPAAGLSMISDLLVEGVGAIAVSKTDGNGFLTIREPGDLGDGPIVGGVGYLIVYLDTEPTRISIIGSAWEDN